MIYKILTENSNDNTNIDGARAEHFNAGMRDGIVKGAFNEGTFTTLASNEISFDTCELRISGHRVVIEEAWGRTFSTKPKTATRYALIGQIIVGGDSSVQFDLFPQLASTKPIKDNLFRQQNGAGTYQVEIGRFTLNTDGNIIDVTRTLDIITGSKGEDLDGTINIGTITTNTLEPGMEAEFDIEQRYDAEQKKVFTDVIVGIPRGADGKDGEDGTIDGFAEELAQKADLTNNEQTITTKEIKLETTGTNYYGETGDAGVMGAYTGTYEHTSITISGNYNVDLLAQRYMTIKSIKSLTISAGSNEGRVYKGSITIDNNGGITISSDKSSSGVQITNDLAVGGTITSNGENVLTQSSLLETVYPVGSIYMSVNNVSPASFVGGTWEQLPAGYALWTASSGAGETIAAGLPNITGQIGGGYGGYITNNKTESGALYTHSQDGAQSAGGSGQQRYHIAFDASRSNSIYGSSTTVQPPAYKIYAWKRTA